MWSGSVDSIVKSLKNVCSHDVVEANKAPWALELCGCAETFAKLSLKVGRRTDPPAWGTFLYFHLST